MPNSKKKKVTKKDNPTRTKVIINQNTGPHGESCEDFFFNPLLFMLCFAGYKLLNVM
jgi:hypothetical protein